MMEMPPEKMEEVEDLLRLDVINSTVNVDKRLEKLYELIENDLLGNLMFSPNYISPYKVGTPAPFMPLTPRLALSSAQSRTSVVRRNCKSA